MPFESFFGAQPDISCLKLFGSWVCVKRTGFRRCKLDRHNFKGLFLGYTATDQNIIYLDLDSGMVKSSHHAEFDEAWYLQPTRPPAAQLLYDLGVLPETDPVEGGPPVHDADNATLCKKSCSSGAVPWPPLAPFDRVLQSGMHLP